MYTPKAKPVQLNQLLKDLVAAQQKRQKTLNTLQKQDNWAFLVQAGAQQNLSARYNQTVQPYINVALRYNLGSTHSNHLLDSAENSFIAWQKEELLGLPKKLAGLVHSLTTLKAAEEDRLTYLTQSYRKYQSVSQRIGSIDSSEATHFKQELEIDRMLTHIEIQHVQHTISLIERAIT